MATANFKRLGRKQMYLINKMVIEDYYIVRTLDLRDMSVVISLEDEHGNTDRDITEKELSALIDRGILLSVDGYKCDTLEQQQYFINEEYAKEAMNACCKALKL